MTIEKIQSMLIDNSIMFSDVSENDDGTIDIMDAFH